jgi:non-ribosomal peptide synthetase component F
MTTLVQDILRVGQDKTTRLPQRKQFLTGFKTTIRTDPYDECVHEMFETQVEKSPEAIAVVCGDKQFTYRELNARANQLAHFLKRFGVGPNSLVGLFVERSPEMIVGILGTLKAGAAYVPIDPTFSTDRLSFILQDANIFVLLTQSHMFEALPRHNGPRLSLDSDWDIIAKERKNDPPTSTNTADLAYVIYPSASTGRPKGVVISHRGLVNYLSWGVEAHELAKGSGTRVDSSISFDLAITRVLSPLIIGKSVFLPEVWEVKEDGFH